MAPTGMCSTLPLYGGLVGIVSEEFLPALYVIPRKRESRMFRHDPLDSRFRGNDDNLASRLLQPIPGSFDEARKDFL